MQFSVLLSTCYSGYPYPAKYLLIEPQKTLKGILLHLEHAPAHNSRLSSEKIESGKVQRVPHPLYSPDVTPNDFFLFRYLKDKLRGTLFTRSDDLIFAMTQLFSEIPEIVLKNVFTDRITRLSWVMKKDGEYYTK
jgi:hypothetical protein